LGVRARCACVPHVLLVYVCSGGSLAGALGRRRVL
jgi:hypothetical protein